MPKTDIYLGDMRLDSEFSFEDGHNEFLRGDSLAEKQHSNYPACKRIFMTAANAVHVR